jgi:hypothetical protein
VSSVSATLDFFFQANKELVLMATNPQLCGTLMQQCVCLDEQLNTVGFRLTVSPQTTTTATTTGSSGIKKMARKTKAGASNQAKSVAGYWSAIKAHQSETSCTLPEARAWYKTVSSCTN